MTALTVIMLSKEDQAFEILQDILRIKDPSQQEEVKNLTEQLVSVYTEFAGVVVESDEETISPYKKKLSIKGEKNFKFNQDFLLEKLDKTEKELNQLKTSSKVKDEKVINLEHENQILIDENTKLKSQLEGLNLENEDFKNRANIGMIDVLELELKQKRQQVKELSARLEDKQKEYSKKLQDYKDQFNDYRTRINDLEVYKGKYEDLMAKDNGNQNGGIGDEELREEYEK